jgi:histidyl-tRNA synthetase
LAKYLASFLVASAVAFLCNNSFARNLIRQTWRILFTLILQYMETLSNLPVRWTYDWFPDEFMIRKYIFDTWRKTCLTFWYQEYLGPLVEPASIWQAKSWEDIGWSELTCITTRTGEVSELALRPEMTPTVTRMVSRIYTQTPKPIRYFSIANFYRNERPQRWRNREFWQLNIDIFGSESMMADIEILTISLEIMLAFSPPDWSFIIKISSRKILQSFLSCILGLDISQQKSVARTMDKWNKLSREDFLKTLTNIWLTNDQSRQVILFLSSPDIATLAQYFPNLIGDDYQELDQIFSTLWSLGYAQYIRFDPSMIRWFDYYDWLVFEVFDTNPENARSLFWGGRYNWLANIFWKNSFPAVGCAPGDEPLRLWLESWNMIKNIQEKSRPNIMYVPFFEYSNTRRTTQIAQYCRKKGYSVITGVTPTNMRKSLEYANKIKASWIVFDNLDGTIDIKDMQTGEQLSESFL